MSYMHFALKKQKKALKAKIDLNRAGVPLWRVIESLEQEAREEELVDPGNILPGDQAQGQGTPLKFDSSSFNYS